jgi:two-component system, response regulator PdtaR
MDLVAILEREGHRVYEAAHANEAIKMMEAHPDITVLFTDIDMPGSMDGIKLSHYVRNRWPPVKIIVASERRTPSRREMPSDAMFISKPYGELDLQRVFTVARGN